MCSLWAVGHSRLTSDGLFQSAAYQLGWFRRELGRSSRRAVRQLSVGQVTPTRDCKEEKKQNKKARIPGALKPTLKTVDPVRRQKKIKALTRKRVEEAAEMNWLNEQGRPAEEMKS